jgi:hypothetical protein
MTQIEREIFMGMVKDIPHEVLVYYLEVVRDKNDYVKTQQFEIAGEKRDQERALTTKYPILHNLRDIIPYNNMNSFIREIKLNEILC